MTKQYSFIVYAPSEVMLDAVGLSLDPGCNVFSTFTKDVESLIASFEGAGVQVLEVNRIDVPKTTVADLLLDGESLTVLSPYAWRP